MCVEDKSLDFGESIENASKLSRGDRDLSAAGKRLPMRQCKLPLIAPAET